MSDFSIEIAGVAFANPIIVGSCSLTNNPETIERLVEAGAGGVITKTISPDPLPGPPRSFSTGTFGRSLAVASDWRLSLEDGAEVITATRKAVKVPVVANVIGRSDDPEVWAETCVAMERAGASMIELDLNGHPEGDLVLDVPANLAFFNALSIGQDPKITARVVEAARAAVDIPVVSKMTLRAPDILGVAMASEQAGAHVVSGVNTLHGVANVDVDDSGAPLVPGQDVQSLVAICGPDLAALGTKWTALIGKAIAVPYISGSGVMTSRDAIERIMLGAHGVAICSALYLNGLQALSDMVAELETFCDRHDIATWSDVRGAAANRLVDRGEPRRRPVVARVADQEVWMSVADDVYRTSELACACIKRTPKGVEFDESRCTGCALPALHAPEAVAMVDLGGRGH